LNLKSNIEKTVVTRECVNKLETKYKQNLALKYLNLNLEPNPNLTNKT